MRKILLLAFATVILLSVSAFGSFWNQNGDFYDFGDNYFTDANNTSEIYYPSGIGNHPSPGHLAEGGEKFDIEGAFMAMDESYLYFGLTNSFGLFATSTYFPGGYGGQTYPLGHLFFGFNGNTFTNAVDFQNERVLLGVTSTNKIPSIPGAYTGTIRDEVGAFTAKTWNSQVGVETHRRFVADLEDNPYYSNNGDTYLLEVKIDRTLFGITDWSQVQCINVRQTLACGNDVMEDSFSAPVPEPSTLVLLGLGLLGAGAIRKYRKS